MRLCYDIETNGLEPDIIWCLVAIDIDTDKIYKFSDHDDYLPGIKEGVKLLQHASLLVGHNIIAFDNYWIKQLYGVNLSRDVKCHDTLIMSRVLNYKRTHAHGLKGWGMYLQNSKIDYDDWSGYSKEMMRYCIQDVRLNVNVYRHLTNEMHNAVTRNKLIVKGMQVEHDIAYFAAVTKEQGWNFDTVKANETLNKMDKRMAEIESVIEPKLGKRTVYIDKTPKTAKYTKAGWYTATTARLLSEFTGRTIKPEDALTAAPVSPGQEFQRSTQEQIKLGQTALVKEWLLSNGWKPDDYTRKRIDGVWVNQGPKLTATSLENFMGDIGKMIAEYYTTRNRRSVLAGWLENLKEGRLHGTMQTVGTPSMRCTHGGIVNLPAVGVLWGKELRELLIADEGWTVVGADSSGNQLRGLCHYVGDPEYTDVVVNGDQHQRNADALGCSRSDAKTFLYAYLFGAGDAKLSSSVNGGVMNAAKGKAARQKFASSIKGLEEMNSKLQSYWNMQKHNRGEGFIPGLDGRPVYAPMEHNCLNYLLQCAEGITCKAAVSYAMQKIREEGLRAKPRLFYHDEQAWTAHPDDADRVGEILQESFKEAPKWFGVQCMDGGDYVKGTSYADVH